MFIDYVELQNEKASEDNATNQATLKEAEKHCKLLLGRVSRGNGCLKAFVLLTVGVAVGAAFMSDDLKSLDVKKLLVDLKLS